MPDGWDIVRIGELKERVSNRVDPQEFPEDKYLSLKHLDKSSTRAKSHGYAEEVSSKKYRFKEGDILFGRLRPYFRKVIKTEFGGVCSTDMDVIRPKEGVDRDFLHYTLFRQDFINIADKTSTGTRMPRADWDVLDDVLVALPPMEEQKRIGEALNNLDSKIDSNKRVISLCNQVSQAIFRNWFIELEPFEEEPRSYRDGIGREIPDEWQVKQMSEVAKVVDCLHSKKPDEQDYGNFYIEVNDIGENGELALDNKYLISAEDYEKWTRRITAKPGDVIISKDGRVGAVAQIPEGVEGAIGRNLVCIRPDKEQLSPPLLREYMLSPLMKAEIGRKTLSRSIFETLHVSEIEDLRVILPPKEVRQAFDNLVRPLHEQINHNIKESITLEQVRNTLLPELLSGHVRIDPDNN
ncbi:Type I restriction modification DNA specificity domain-containing protein [Natronorubrum sediminis]|uniref:Type I restriction modification DNA specificity domain-containing protein n=1 Tax=Natronorubrum sediminis TaxID=640943 RepID=A0A1H6FKX5_9EURY|nr:Type I restriction modification DNA specificity domain-containing protein [Natronorubrum sediminis]